MSVAARRAATSQSRLSTARQRALIEALCSWFCFNARDLPWRRTLRGRRDPYRSLVAEIMLQQTQVSRVVASYQEFVRRFPTVRALAAANEQDVLGSWRGLGYYRRALHLHAAAKLIATSHRGNVPRTVGELRRLPGVGRYTAGAIASIVFGANEPLVDGNVARVLARWSGVSRSDTRDQAEWAWRIAKKLVHQAAQPGAFNEALMELGATVCTPKSPRCEVCPVATFCRANALGVQNEIHARRRNPTRRRVHHHAIVIRRPKANQVLIEQRRGKGMWSAMWQVPTVEADRALSVDEITSRVQVKLSALARVAEFEHATTHRAITFHVFTTTSASRRGIWRSMTALNDLPMSSAQRRVLACAANHPVDGPSAASAAPSTRPRRASAAEVEPHRPARRRGRRLDN